MDTLRAVMSVVVSLLLVLRTWAHSRAALQLEILALSHRLQVLRRTRPLRVRLAKTDRWLWGRSRAADRVRTVLLIVNMRCRHWLAFRLLVVT